MNASVTLEVSERAGSARRRPYRCLCWALLPARQNASGVPPAWRCGCSWDRQSDRPPNDQGWFGLRFTLGFPGTSLLRQFDHCGAPLDTNAVLFMYAIWFLRLQEAPVSELSPIVL